MIWAVYYIHDRIEMHKKLGQKIQSGNFDRRIKLEKKNMQIEFVWPRKTSDERSGFPNS